MITNTYIKFLNRECKNGLHQNCCGRWNGLGFEIICSCRCGHYKNNKNEKAPVVQVGSSATDTGNDDMQSSNSQEEVQRI
jgi:hypothetical protein